MTFGLGDPPGEAYARLDPDSLSSTLLNIRLVDPDMF
jgi:hypothetical protein